jgi:NADH dehydrogenase
VEAVAADIADEESVRSALAGSIGAVNVVSLYVEQGARTFDAIHVDAAGRLARLAQAAGLESLVHLSGIGADPASASPYIRSRGQGELAVRAGFPAATILRPAVMFGVGDAFLSSLVDLLRRTPVFPLFGRGATRLQPAAVDDVASAVVVLSSRSAGDPIFELGGPDVISYRDVIRSVAASLRRNPLLLPVPFALWHAAARAAELLPEPPITRNQVELMRIDSVVAPGMPGFDRLGIRPRSMEEALPEIARAA